MSQKAPGKSHREGISIIELTEMFPNEASAVKWFEDTRWPDGERHCGHCGSTETKEVPNAKPMPYWCKACRSYFSVRTGSMLQSSRLPLRKWVFAVYLYVTNLKGVSSMKLHRDLKVTQKTAWFMLHRLREAWDDSGLGAFDGPVEADETYMGGKRKNMPKSKRKKLTGRGAVGKEAVVGTKDRESNKVAARHVQGTDAPHVAGFVAEKARLGAKAYTDEASVYNALHAFFDHESVNHSAGEYVREQAHNQWDGVLLVDAEAGLSRDLPQDEPEAPGPLHQRILGPAQRARGRHHRPDGSCCHAHDRQALGVPHADCRQRPVERRTLMLG